LTFVIAIRFAKILSWQDGRHQFRLLRKGGYLRWSILLVKAICSTHPEGCSAEFWRPATQMARLQAAGTVINEIMAAPDKGIPEELLNGAKCIAVVPNMGKGGFIVGGEHGRGVVTCRTAHGWSAPAFISIGGGNFGFQAGAQSVDLVILSMNDKGVQGLLSSKFELSGEASATAGPVGRHASAGTDWKMNTEGVSYSRTKGLFVGVAVDGTKSQQDKDSTIAMYGKHVSFRKTLSGSAHAPVSSDAFVAAVKSAERQESQHETAESK
jgi:SH3 domain-containing YSC84-like protein 1